MQTFLTIEFINFFTLWLRVQFSSASHLVYLINQM